MITENGEKEKNAISYEEYVRLQEEFSLKQKNIEERLWLDATISQFDNLLRLNYSKSTEEFAKVVLQQIAEDTQAFMGVFYVYNKEEELCKAAASYAYKLEKMKQTAYQIGEGIIGQTLESKKMLYFENLPPNSLDLSMLSVKINASNMLILPLLFNEEIFGVIELLYLKPLEAKYQSLLQTISRNIASMLESIFNNMLTQKLLSDSQQQAEALRAQEEEMRQNLEELQTTQEEMSRKDIEMRGVLNAIDATLATVEITMEGKIQKVNDAFLKIFSYQADELIDQHYSKLVDNSFLSTEDYTKLIENLKQGNSQIHEIRNFDKHGNEVWMNNSFTPVKDSKGEYHKVLILGQNISQRKKADIETQRLSLVADNTDNSVIITDKNGLIEYVNKGFSRMSGYSLEEVLGRKPGSFLQGKDTNPDTVARISEKLKQNISFYEEILNYAKNGETYWISLAINPIFNKSGALEKYIAVQANITETKIAALDLKGKMEAIDKTYGVVEFDTQGYIQKANEIFLNRMGYTLEELRGKHHRLLVSGEEKDSEEYKAFWNTLGTEGKFISGEFLRISKNGEKVWLRGSYNAVLNLSGKPYKVVKYVQDITEQKLLENTNRQQNEELLAQQEELRQNMEELEATQEETFRKQARLDAQVFAMDNSKIMRIEFDTDGFIIDANQEFLNAFGFESDKIINQHHRILVDSEYAKSPGYKQFWKELREGKSQQGEFVRFDAQGNQKWLSATYSPIFNREGKVEKILKLALDITEMKTLLRESQQQTEELKTQEEELRQNMEELQSTQEEMYRKQARLDAQGYAVDHSKILRIEFKPDGHILDANQTFLDTFGFSIEDILNKHHKILVDKDYAHTPEYKVFWKELREGKSQQGEFVRFDALGNQKWLSATYSPIFDKEGKVEKILKLALDITDMKVLLRESQQQTEELKTQEEELRQNMEELQSTQDELQKQFARVNLLKQDLDARINVFNVSTILSEADLHGNIIYVNQKLMDVSQYTEKELLGKPHNMLRHPDMPKEVFKVFWQTIQSGKIFRGIVKNRKKDGSHYWVDAVVAPVKNEKDEIIKYIGVRYLIEDDALAENLYEKMLHQLAEQE